MMVITEIAPKKRRARQAKSSADETVIDTREAVQVSKARAKSSPTVGFGCPPLSEWPHHVVIVIPPGRGGDIRVVENTGIQSDSEDVERCVVPRPRWSAMAEAAKSELNSRLREKGLPTSRWQSGENRVDRILGTELLTLAWAVSAADEADVPAVVSAWVSLQSSERLWLAGRVLSNLGAENVRRGVALLLSAGPSAVESRPKQGSKGAPAVKGVGGLPLFEIG